MLTANVLRIEKTSIHDGDGIRTVVFLKGCLLTCLWCSTPESQNMLKERSYHQEKCQSCMTCVENCPSGALTIEKRRVVHNLISCTRCFRCVSECPHDAVKEFGRDMSVEQIMTEIVKDEIFYFHSGGGVTISGGECLVHADFVASLLKECRFLGINTAIETSLYCSWDQLTKVLPHVDSLYVDLKHSADHVHRELTGVGNKKILRNLHRIDESNFEIEIILRVPLIPGLNDDKKNLLEIQQIALNSPKSKAIEILPYHRLGVSTYAQLNRVYDLPHLKAPERDYIFDKVDFLKNSDSTIPIIIGGGFG